MKTKSEFPPSVFFLLLLLLFSSSPLLFAFAFSLFLLPRPHLFRSLFPTRTTVGQFVQKLLTEHSYYGTLLKRLPIPFVREVQKRLIMAQMVKEKAAENEIYRGWYQRVFVVLLFSLYSLSIPSLFSFVPRVGVRVFLWVLLLLGHRFLVLKCPALGSMCLTCQ
jgi:hypothetical protein